MPDFTTIIATMFPIYFFGGIALGLIIAIGAAEKSWLPLYVALLWPLYIMIAITCVPLTAIRGKTKSAKPRRGNFVA